MKKFLFLIIFCIGLLGSSVYASVDGYPDFPEASSDYEYYIIYKSGSYIQLMLLGPSSKTGGEMKGFVDDTYIYTDYILDGSSVVCDFITYRLVGTNWNKVYNDSNVMKVNLGSKSNIELLFSNFNFYNYSDGSIYFEGGSVVSLPEMENPFTNTELVSLYAKLVNSESLKNYLPSDYTDFFITYNEEFGEYMAYFYRKNYYPYGYVYPAGYDFISEVFEYPVYNIKFSDSSLLPSTPSDLVNIYVFSSNDNSNDFWYFDTLNNLDLSPNLYNYDSNPIVFSTKDFIFYHFDLEGNVDLEKNTVVNSTTIKDEETGEDIVITTPSEDKDDNSIWAIINGIPDKIKNLLTSIFVPNISDIKTLDDLISQKLLIINESKEVIDSIINIFSNSDPKPPTVVMNLSNSNSSIDYGNEAVCIDFSWYEPYKGAVDAIIIGFVYIVFFVRLFYKLPSIISGSDSIFDSISAKTSGGNTDRKGGNRK